MARLDPAAAALAAADLHLVAADHAGLRWGKVFLVLAGDPLQPKLAAAARAGVRQRHRHHPVDPLRHWPPPVPPIGRTRLAARPPGMRGGPVLGERRGLALARPAQLLHPGDQHADAGHQPLVVSPQPLDLTGKPVALGRHRLAPGLHHHDPLAQPAHRLTPMASSPTRRPCHRGPNHTP
jgi:hypothetical protein